MNIEKGRISASQLFFLGVGFFLGSILNVTLASGLAKQETWLALLGGFILSIPFIWSQLRLATLFPAKNLIQINDLVYGRYLGKFISLLYIWFFGSLVSINLRYFGDFFLTFIMPDTPLSVFLIFLAMACAYTVNRGLETIAKTAVFYVLIVFFFIVMTTLLLCGEMQFGNLLPIGVIPLKDLGKGIFILAVVPFLETVVFLMIIPSVRPLTRGINRYGFALAMGCLILLIICLRDIATLGNTFPIFTAPFLEAGRLISLAKIFTRMELLIATGLLLGQFIKVSIFYYGSVLSLAQLFNLNSLHPLILPFGALTVGLAILVAESTIEQAVAILHYYAIYAIPFEFILPPLTFLLAKTRGLPKKKRGEAIREY